MTPKRILITGAVGFPGSHVCDKFIHESRQVIGFISPNDPIFPKIIKSYRNK